jgi:DNA-binding NarL/FixJ family response regulator
VPDRSLGRHVSIPALIDVTSGWVKRTRVNWLASRLLMRDPDCSSDVDAFSGNQRRPVSYVPDSRVVNTASPANPVRSVLVVEDEDLLRDLLASALEKSGFHCDVAASAADARDVFERGDHDALVLDVNLGSGPNGFDFADFVIRRSPSTAIVFLTSLPDPRFAERDSKGLPKGIAYLRKSNVSEMRLVVDALEAALRGVRVGDFRHDIHPDRPLAGLTRKQVRVMRLAATGMTNNQIALECGVGANAVDDTIRRAFQVLRVPGRVEGNVRVAAVRRFLEVTGGHAMVCDRGGELA